MSTPADAEGGSGGSAPLPRMLRAVTLVGSPVAVGTGLLFYFGWVRTTRQARALGYDTTVLDLSTADYLLKSVNVLFLPVVVLLLAALVLHTLHVRFRDAMPSWLVRVVTWSWLGLLALGVVVCLGIPAVAADVLPFGLTAVVGAYLYGRLIQAARHGGPGPGRTTRALLLVVLGLVLFWDVEVVAGEYGTGFAANIAARREHLPSVTVYSRDRLVISGPLVVKRKIDTPDSAYRYSYSGLLLVQRSADRYFLLAVGATPATGKLIIVEDGDAVRFEVGSR